jgi:NAD+ diphosphatase
MSPRPDLGPKPRLGYTASPIDRAAERRSDAVFLATLAEAKGAGAYAICGELIVARRGSASSEPLWALDEAHALAPAHEMVFLGLVDGSGRFGVALDPAAGEALKARGDLLVTDLRSVAVQGLVTSEHLPPIAQAKALLQWHARHRYCANCGAPTQAIDGGWRRDCNACGGQHFPRTDPVAIMLAVRGDFCLLGRQSRFVPGMWSCLAGFIEPGECIEEAVRRETFEEAGIRCGRISYLASQPWPFPMSLMIGCFAEALTSDIVVDHSELENARWFDREEAALLFLRRHPEGLTAPPPVAIAHHILRAWLESDDVFR